MSEAIGPPREQVDVAALFASEPADALAASSATRWSGLEAAQFDVFRDNATGPLPADLEAVLFSPSGITVTAVRDALANRALDALREPSLAGWVEASGTRIASLRDLQSGARKNLAATASNDLAASRRRSLRDVGISLAVLLVVTGLALALRRSITSPLREVSEAAQHMSGGDLTVQVRYRGRDEIGDVATAFRNLHVTVERLAEEIREMTAAVRHNRLEHRVDIAAFEGTWSQLMTGLNDTMAAFAELEGRRERAERELSDFFQLSLDLLCIGNFDGYFTRVNPAFERTLGYPLAELTSRPFGEFVHPDPNGNPAGIPLGPGDPQPLLSPFAPFAIGGFARGLSAHVTDTAPGPLIWNDFMAGGKVGVKNRNDFAIADAITQVCGPPHETFSRRSQPR
jgi:PAS domain-containing protein